MLLFQKQWCWELTFFLLQIIFLQTILTSRLIGMIPHVTGSHQGSVSIVQFGKVVFNHQHSSVGFCWVEAHTVLSKSFWKITHWNQSLKSMFLPWPPFSWTMCSAASSTWPKHPLAFFVLNSWPLDCSAELCWGAQVSVRLLYGIFVSTSNLTITHKIKIIDNGIGHFARCAVTPPTLGGCKHNVFSSRKYLLLAFCQISFPL